MKIAVIGVKGIPSSQGEIERYCQEFYPRIAARGHQVDLFVPAEPNIQSWFSVGYYYNVRVIALASFPKKQASMMLSSALSTVWATLGGYDVIHIQGMKAAWFSWFPNLFSRAKIVVTNHQLDLADSDSIWEKIFHSLLPWMEKAAVKNVHEMIVISKALGEYFQHKYNISPRYIPNAPRSHLLKEIKTFEDLEFDYGMSLGLKAQKYILYLGKLTPENNPDLLLRAFQKLEPQGWKLVIAGGISNSLEYAITLLNLAQDNSSIIFTNEIKDKNLVEIISHAGLLVVPSDGSDFKLPLSVLEAMQLKIPVLASDNPVYRELIGEDEERGLLFKSAKLDSLVEKLQYALAQPEALIAMAQKAQTYVTINHNWDRVTYGNLSLYLQITSNLDSSSVQFK